MQFEHVLVDALPGCAWCLDVPTSLARATLLHGSRVEVFDGFFFEGAWAGPVDRPPRPDAAVYGTGGSVRGGRVEVYTSIFKKHGVFFIEGNDALYLSNSMPLLLTYTGRDLEPSHVHCWHYHMALIAIGHAISEDPGMKACADWLKTFVIEVPVEWIPAGEPFAKL